MKALRVGLVVVVALAAVYGLGRLFVLQLRGAGGAAAPPGVVLAPPPGFAVEQGGELERTTAARRLAALLARQPQAPQLGLHFTSDGSELFWLVDRRDGAAPSLRELAASAAGTRVATTWQGTPAELERRLAWALAHGTFAAPGLPPGDGRNLYH